MAKSETPAENPVVVRPPRPAPRGSAVARQAEAAASISSAALRLAPRSRGANASGLSDAGGLSDDDSAEVAVASNDRGDARLRAPESIRDTTRDEVLREERATEEFFVGEEGVSRAHRVGEAGSVDKAGALSDGWAGREVGGWGWAVEDGRNVTPHISGLPCASLRGPSDSHLDLTPSPVPRVSLAPATAPVDVSAIPGPHQPSSRNLPTLAARHVRVSPASGDADARGKGGKFQRGVAAAMTYPPGTVSSPLRQSRIARRLARDVRSSKREIALGLSIGIGLSAVLCLIGQSYLDDRRHPHLARGGGVPAHVAGSDEGARAVPGPYREVDPLAQTSSGLLPKSMPRSVPNSVPGPAPVATSTATASAARSPLFPAAAQSLSPTSTSAAPAVPRSGSGTKQRATAARRASASKGDSRESASEAEAGAGPAGDKAPLSPAESAGLGLDLPF